jgi:DNA-directed RNA polymerase subunit K/omega
MTAMDEVEVQLEVNERPEQPEASPVPLEPPPPIKSRFLFVDIAALRAKQLRRGARARLDSAEAAAPHAPQKPERVAMEEVRRGLVLYGVADRKPAHAEEQG